MDSATPPKKAESAVCSLPQLLNLGQVILVVHFCGKELVAQEERGMELKIQILGG